MGTKSYYMVRATSGVPPFETRRVALEAAFFLLSRLTRHLLEYEAPLIGEAIIYA